MLRTAHNLCEETGLVRSMSLKGKKGLKIVPILKGFFILVLAKSLVHRRYWSPALLCGLASLYSEKLQDIHREVLMKMSNREKEHSHAASEAQPREGESNAEVVPVDTRYGVHTCSPGVCRCQSAGQSQPEVQKGLSQHPHPSQSEKNSV